MVHAELLSDFETPNAMLYISNFKCDSKCLKVTFKMQHKGHRVRINHYLILIYISKLSSFIKEITTKAIRSRAVEKKNVNADLNLNYAWSQKLCFYLD